MEFFKKLSVIFSVFASIAVFSIVILLQNIKEDVQLKDNLIDYAKKIKNFIYLEATIHNPNGDMLPDQIDDTIISEAKKILY
jgi:uncharacterized protein YeeX (DUF496 family)